ncbi:DUF2950 family protein [Rhizobium sp. LC145]|uniref:DUF2950 family protein n=1 Tax=Rhizobium sp. LC145 TaxID=1120688 RepID=UPI00062A0DC7|nr:DUF2950 family protein [Rhizobium sp. LC145]KKX23859.1 hypothetical protein YH62_28445 [Rhizobium sp. LC145]
MPSKLRHALLAVAPSLFSSAGAQAQTAELLQYMSHQSPVQFDGPTEALTSFREAVANDDLPRLGAILGLDPEKLASSSEAIDSFSLIKRAASDRLLLKDDGNRFIVEIGQVQWPLPFPLVKANGRWAFDTKVGLEEITNRRVGENEIEAITTLRAYVDAQEEYALADFDGDAVLEYAQKLISTPGSRDGLYWPEGQGNGLSPAGDLSQIGLKQVKADEGYFGYRFKVLTRQGSNIAGGTFAYVINGNMIAGFGLVAWPVVYGQTGVQTFVVNRNGIVYQADLGPHSAVLASEMHEFNPDDSWEITED